MSAAVRSQRHRGETGRAFDGVPVHAAPGVHERALSLLERLLRPPARVADLGAGSGAFSRRLQAAGYLPVAVERDVPPSQQAVEWVEADVCCGLADSIGRRSVDAAVALEVVEHLSDPLAFANGVLEILRPGGTLIVSTPNVLHPYSRLKFLARGRFWLFDDADYWSTGHVTPLPEWLLRQHLTRVGFVSVVHGYGGALELRGARGVLAGVLSASARRSSAPLGAVDDCSTLFIAARAPGIRR